MTRAEIPPEVGRSINGLAAATALFAPALVGLPQERLCAAHLDASLSLLKLTCTGSLHEALVEVPVRDVVRDALSVDARALVVAHNHPRGCLRPSAADRQATRRLAEIGRALGIRLIDHLLFAGDEIVSFRVLGLL